MGNLITLGACVSAFACCLACVVGASRLLFAITRDLAPGHRLGHTGANATPAAAAVVVCGTVFVIGCHLRGVLRRQAVRHVPLERHRSAP